MTSRARVPQAEITGIFGAMAKRFTKKKLGQVPEPLGVMWHSRPVLKALFGFAGKAGKWDACDPRLKSFAHMAAANLVSRNNVALGIEAQGLAAACGLKPLVVPSAA